MLIIAEAGVNHNGDISLAKQLIDAAAKAGADMVKFQTFKAEGLVSPEARMAAYQIKNMVDCDGTQFAMLKKLELTEAHHRELKEYCDKVGIAFFSTAFDVEGLHYLNGLGFPRFKVPSGEITNYPYLKLLAEIGKPVILSTGMSTLKEVQHALDVLTLGQLTKADITVLHCNTEYPTPMEDVNLRAMLTIRDALEVSVGYSDHTLGIEVPIAAVALGAKVIEKHFTLDRNMSGPDHKASLEPDELAVMVKAIRNIEKAMAGDGRKIPSDSEQKNIEIARKSIHTAFALKAGHIICNEDLITLRPGNGLSPMKWHEIIGRTIKRDIPKHHLLTWSDLE